MAERKERNDDGGGGGGRVADPRFAGSLWVPHPFMVLVKGADVELTTVRQSTNPEAGHPTRSESIRVAFEARLLRPFFPSRHPSPERRRIHQIPVPVLLGKSINRQLLLPHPCHQSKSGCLLQFPPITNASLSLIFVL